MDLANDVKKVLGILINQSKMLEKKILDKYKAINLLERYKSLSDTFNSKEILEKYDRKQVLTHLKEMNCRFIYNTKEGFFGLKEQEGDYDFRFNISPAGAHLANNLAIPQIRPRMHWLSLFFVRIRTCLPTQKAGLTSEMVVVLGLEGMC